MFGRKSKPPPTRDELVVKLDSLRPGAPPPGPTERLDPEDVTGVIDLALERLQVGHDAGHAALQAATHRLITQTARSIELAQTVLPPPPPVPKKSV
jgi:hypothetical protein